MRRPILLAVLALAVCSPAIVAADRQNPRFETTVPEPTLTPGGSQNLTVQIANDAEDAVDTVKPARNVRVEFNERKGRKLPFEVTSGPRLLGTLRDGDVAEADVTLSVPADVSAGTYRIPLRVTYEYDGDERDRTTVWATVRVDDRARFRVVDATSDVVVGERGTVTLTVENVGSAAAAAARVTLASENADLSIAGSASASRYVGAVAPDEQRTVSFAVTAATEAKPQPYALTARVDYDDETGVAVTSPPLAVGVEPRPKLAFALRNVTSDLRVGRTGTIRGAVANRGERPARNAVLVLETTSGVLRLPESTYPVGTIEPGGTARFDFDVVVPESADAGPRPFTLAVEYEDAEGDVRTGDPVRFRRPVAPERDRFRFEPVNATVVVDTDNRVTVRVTNVGDERLRDVNARLDAAPPFTSEGPESYVPALAPDESATLAFQLTVSEDAVANVHAVPVNVTAETPDGDTITSGPYLVPVTVVEPRGPEASATTLVGGAVLVLVVLGAGWWWLRR
jgi:hypothetical protein